ncbi:hypothetical protein ED733_008860 [Metarhizium rileyi]|uniref:DUF7907 domain-containing protein n=1 Tax=Metarhizium rileyi (strain RCEF 4871) TaxID=1649241 RepID=A0A5C6GLG8_METRR|nr:hypothetical protein ED733_008860 [Metarhizium rileyi]
MVKMLHAAALLLASLATATASPSDALKLPSCDHQGEAKGFNLIINVTDLSYDPARLIHGTGITKLELSKSDTLLIANEYAALPLTFFQNGTDSNCELLADSDDPAFHYGTKITVDEEFKDLSGVQLDFGHAQRGLCAVDRPPCDAFTDRELANLLICKQKVGEYARTAHVLKQHASNRNVTIPEACMPVRLLPECAEFEKPIHTEYSGHDEAATVGCLRNVSDWIWT